MVSGMRVNLFLWALTSIYFRLLILADNDTLASTLIPKIQNNETQGTSTDSVCIPQSPIPLSIDAPLIHPDDTLPFESKVTISLIRPKLNGTIVYYSLDGTNPASGKDNTYILLPDQPITLHKFGIDTLKLFSEVTFCELVNGTAHKITKRSEIVTKRYSITKPKCKSPILIPNGGSFIRMVNVVLKSPFADSSAKICYSLSSFYRPQAFVCVANHTEIPITHTGTNYLYNYAIGHDCTNSSQSVSVYQISQKIENPIISPDGGVFATSITVTVRCATPNVTIHYTINGDTPNLMSLTISNGGQIILDDIGHHVIKILAISSVDSSILPSDVVVKEFTVLERADPPEFNPLPGSYIGSVDLKLMCPSSTSLLINSNSTVYYTMDGFSTPNSHSSNRKCGQFVRLSAPGKYIVRAYLDEPGKYPSSIQQGIYNIKRLNTTEFPVNTSLLFSVHPKVDVSIVQKDLSSYSYCDPRHIRGRRVILENPIGHFDFAYPKGGCRGGGLTLPSISGRDFKSQKPWDLRYLNDSRSQSQYRLFANLFQTKRNDEIAQQIRNWEREYNAAKNLGCQVVTNAGFFNITSGACFGDLVMDGEVVQTSKYHNVNFGIRNGSFVTGYISEEDIRSLSNPFDTLISGLVWLVRDGEVYVSASLSVDREDMNSQSTGPAFASVKSARTAIGHNREGHLMILQVEGETWVRGMSLYEFAEFAVELGFWNAINLDGGGSATMTVNHTLVSEPSWKCTDGFNPQGYFRCEKPVSTITCIHAMAPPIFADIPITETMFPSENPTVFPTEGIPNTREPTSTEVPSSSPSRTNMGGDTNQPVTEDYDTLNTSLEHPVLLLLVLLLISLVMNAVAFIQVYCRKNSPRRQDNGNVIPNRTSVELINQRGISDDNEDDRGNYFKSFQDRKDWKAMPIRENFIESLSYPEMRPPNKPSRSDNSYYRIGGNLASRNQDDERHDFYDDYNPFH